MAAMLWRPIKIFIFLILGEETKWWGKVFKRIQLSNYQNTLDFQPR